MTRWQPPHRAENRCDPPRVSHFPCACVTSFHSLIPPLLSLALGETFPTQSVVTVIWHRRPSSSFFIFTHFYSLLFRLPRSLGTMKRYSYSNKKYSEPLSIVVSLRLLYLESRRQIIDSDHWHIIKAVRLLRRSPTYFAFRNPNTTTTTTTKLEKKKRQNGFFH
jgi:hypothetical protein